MTVVDACAAPGSKTSQLAAGLVEMVPGAVLGPAGVATARDARVAVLAIERDAERAALLQRRMEALGCSPLVRVVRGDFLGLVPTDPMAEALSTGDGADAAAASFKQRRVNRKQKFSAPRGKPTPVQCPGGRVDAVLLDPSCSGSGMAARRFELSGGAGSSAKRARTAGSGAEDAPRPPASAAERVGKLSSFQRAALLHALSLPGCRRVAYSTCSVWGDEDEGVVASALASPTVAGKWKLVKALPDWPTRGMAWPGLSPSEADCLVRADPDTDRTQGFFVALFERVPGSGDDIAPG